MSRMEISCSSLSFAWVETNGYFVPEGVCLQLDQGLEDGQQGQVVHWGAEGLADVQDSVDQHRYDLVLVVYQF